MKNYKNILFAAVLLALPATQSVANAQTIRLAYQSDALSMDPHALNESLQLSLTGNIYEPLVGRNKDLSLTPILAMLWSQISPNVWRFTLRAGAQFHDGTLLTADDVVFSFARAAGPGSDVKSYVNDIQEVRKVEDGVVEIETKTPSPILPDVISMIYIMSKSWCEIQQAAEPADASAGGANGATLRTNGTGPFRLGERQAGVRSVFVRNPTYWGKIDGNVQEVIFTPIADDATRVTALLSGTVDVMEPVPVQDIVKINASTLARAVAGPELRTVFLGMDQHRDTLLYASVKGKNPFKDKRVRQAFYQAIDIDDIKSTVMGNASSPTALLVGPGVNGFLPEQNKRLPFDLAEAKKNMANAGYPNGFELTMNCPTDRYINDAAICRAVAANLARIDVKIKLQAEPKTGYFPKILRRDTSFYLLGWTPGTYDAHDALNALTACTNNAGAGEFNLGGYCNPTLDLLTAKIQSETDKTRRNAMIKEAFDIHRADIGHIPLHQQALAWGVSKRVTLVQRADNFMYFKWMSIQ